MNSYSSPNRAAAQDRLRERRSRGYRRRAFQKEGWGMLVVYSGSLGCCYLHRPTRPAPLCFSYCPLSGPRCKSNCTLAASSTAIVALPSGGVLAFVCTHRSLESCLCFGNRQWWLCNRCRASTLRPDFSPNKAKLCSQCLWPSEWRPVPQRCGCWRRSCAMSFEARRKHLGVTEGRNR